MTHNKKDDEQKNFEDLNEKVNSLDLQLEKQNHRLSVLLQKLEEHKEENTYLTILLEEILNSLSGVSVSVSLPKNNDKTNNALISDNVLFASKEKLVKLN